MIHAVSCSAGFNVNCGRSAILGLVCLTKSVLVQDAPKLKAAIVGSGLAGLSTAVELLDQGYEVDIYESRPFIGGKVASWQKDGNHVEMGLHVVSILMGNLATHSAMQCSRTSGCLDVSELLAPLLSWELWLRLAICNSSTDYPIVSQ